MKCEDVRGNWNAYVNGECSEEEEREMEEHIQTCAECERFVDGNLNQQEPVTPNSDLPELTQKQQQKIVRKAVWKNRIMTALTVFWLIFIICVVSTMITGVYYAFLGHTGNKVIQTTMQMRIPNVYSSGSGTSMNVFFNADLQGDLYKELGYESKYIGEYHGKMILSHLNVSRDWVDGRHDIDLYFLPPQGSKEIVDSWKQDEAFKALDILPEGTVAELAVSFNDLYTIDEVYEIFEGYDLDIVWYAIDTGTEKNNYVLGAGELWGIHEYGFYTLLDDEDRSLIEEKGEGYKREKAFKNGLEFLAEHKKLAKRVLLSRNLEENGTLEEIIDYVDEYGVKSYGVVVTGPTKELLKLKENERVLYATLGEVDLWNWYAKPADWSLY